MDPFNLTCNNKYNNIIPGLGNLARCMFGMLIIK